MGSKTKTKMPCGRPLESGTVVHAGGAVEGSGWKQKLDEFQKKAGLNQSEARRRIAEVAVAQASHFTAPEIVRKIQERHPSIGPATVYRNLPVLIEAGIIQESLSTQHGQTVYEASDSEHHDHVVCLDCDAIFEFHDEKIEERQDKVLDSMSFTEECHRHVIFARCEYRQRAKT